MKRIFIISTVLFLSSLFVNGQNVETIISKHIEAHGGIDNWNSIKSMKITGQFTSFSVTNDFFSIIAKPNSFYSEYHMGIHKVTEGYNGEIGWTINPWFDIPFPRRTNSTEENVIQQKAVFCTPLFYYKEEGFKVEYKGKENVEGTEVFTIELTKPSGQIETWYLNTKTYLEHICKSTWSDFASPSPQEVYYSDFRKVGNVTIPFFVERTFDTRIRETQIEKVEFNIEIDDDIFKMPLSDEMKKLKFFEGDWNVKVDMASRRGWYTSDSTSSSFKFVNNMGLLQEKMTYSRFFPVSIINNWTFNSKTNKYRITTFNDFYSDINVFEGTYENDSIIYDNINISFDTTAQAAHRRCIIKDITKDSFVIDIASSRDKGINWQVVQKFYYTRKPE